MNVEHLLAAKLFWDLNYVGTKNVPTPVAARNANPSITMKKITIKARFAIFDFCFVIQSWNKKIGFIWIFRFQSIRKSKNKNWLDFHILICCLLLLLFWNKKQVVFCFLASVRKIENQTILSPYNFHLEIFLILIPHLD